MWRNKHVVVALLVAPILALLAYFAVDAMVAERAQPALAGESYVLLGNSECRRPGGRCVLSNGDFSITLEVIGSDEGAVRINALTSHALDGIWIGDTSAAPNALNRTIADDFKWLGLLGERSGDSLGVVAKRDGVTYYADVGDSWLPISR